MVEIAQKQMSAYSEAVKSGLYEKQSGLVGKYDNVRRYWEDEITRMFLLPYLKKLIARCEANMKRLRIMDIGCGSADGYELLAGIRDRDADLQQLEVDLLSQENLGVYKGVDLNGDLLDQARTIYGHDPKMIFHKADFTGGLPISPNEDTYDLYFSSYGTFSHHNDDQTAIQLLADIASKTKDYSLIVCDWLGRYSYEWQSLWTDKPVTYKNMDYVVSYIYAEEEREELREQLNHLNLRLMSRPEAENIVKQASKLAGVKIKPLQWFDRSVFCGRHMDTSEYNQYTQKLRYAINSLHENNIRTELSSLLLNYVPKPGFYFLNEYFEHLQICWNTLVKYVDHLMRIFDEEKREFAEVPPPPPVSAPKPLSEMMERMKLVVKGIGWLKYGLPRENIIEPQLGYALRYLICSLQNGQGAAHSLVGILEVDRNHGEA